MIFMNSKYDFLSIIFFYGRLIIMLLKIIIVVLLSIYVVLAVDNLTKNDSHLLVERLYIILKNLYYNLLYG